MKKGKNILILLMLATIGIFAYTNVSLSSKYKRASQDLSESNKAFEINVEQLDKLQEENEGLKKTLKEYKDVESVTKVITNTIIDTVFYQYDNRIAVSDSGTFVGNVSIDSLFYSFDCTFSESSFTLNRLEIPNESNIVIGDKKIRGLFGIPKGREYAIDIVNTNPYVQTVNIQTYKIVEEKKWYQTKGFAIGIGFFGGFMMAK
jgi:hypothetical protein